MNSGRIIKNCVNCTCKSIPFKELANDELIQMNKNRVELTFKRGETLFKQGALAGHIVFLKSGLVKVYREQNNEELILSLEGKGKMLGMHAITSSIYPYSVAAYEDVTVCLLDLNSIKQLMETNSRFSNKMFLLINEDSLFLYDRMTCLTLKQLHGRFADLLLCLSLRIYRRKEFQVPLTKKDMAAVMNMSQESFSRVLKEFTDDSIIEYSGNRIKILNFPKVKNLSIVG